MRTHVFRLLRVLCCLLLVCSACFHPVTHPVRAEAIDSEDASIDAVLVMDVSGSMAHTDPDHLIGQAGRDFLALLPPGTSRAALLTFSHELQTVTDLLPLAEHAVSAEGESAAEPLQALLDGLTYTSGDTDIGLALASAVELLQTERDASCFPCILLFTDGEIDLPNAEVEQAAEEASLRQALVAAEEAKDSGIAIHTITLDPEGQLDHSLTGYLAERTGGSAQVVSAPAALSPAFSEAAQEAVYSARLLAQAERSAQISLPETEAETQPATEEMTETERETETEPVPAVLVSGSIDGPVRLAGLLPGLCSGSVDLRTLFRSDTSLTYTAYAEDGTRLACSVEGDTLLLKGLANGQTTVWVFAHPEQTADPGDFARGEAAAEAQYSFQVRVQALFPSVWFPVAALTLLLLVVALLLLLKRAGGGTAMSGMLQWVVKREGQTVFGVPAHARASLSACGKRARLSDLMEGDRLEELPLSRIVLSAHRGGLRVESHTASCLLFLSDGAPLRRLDLYETTHFEVHCDTIDGKITLVLLYTPQGAAAGYERAEPADERTRLLV